MSLDNCFGSSEVLRKSAIIPANEIMPLEVEVVYREDGVFEDDLAEIASAEDENDQEEEDAHIPEPILSPVQKMQTMLVCEDASPEETDPVAYQHFQKALVFVSNNQFDKALHEVEQGSVLVPETNSLYSKLLTIRAEVLGRRGEFESSLQTYQRVLEYQREQATPPDLTASLYYACGRLSVYLRDFMQALEYYTQELLLTRAVSGESLAVARIYHDLAKVAELGLGDWTQALVYYEQALCIEVAVWRHAKESNSGDKLSHDDLKEALHQIPETKKCIGRIHFALGNIDEALRLSGQRFSLTA